MMWAQELELHTFKKGEEILGERLGSTLLSSCFQQTQFHLDDNKSRLNVAFLTEALIDTSVEQHWSENTYNSGQVGLPSIWEI